MHNKEIANILTTPCQKNFYKWDEFEYIYMYEPYS